MRHHCQVHQNYVTRRKILRGGGLHCWQVLICIYKNILLNDYVEEQCATYTAITLLHVVPSTGKLRRWTDIEYVFHWNCCLHLRPLNWGVTFVSAFVLTSFPGLSRLIGYCPTREWALFPKQRWSVCKPMGVCLLLLVFFSAISVQRTAKKFLFLRLISRREQWTDVSNI